MGRELRMVPPGFEHPRDDQGNFIPLHNGSYSKRVADWDEEAAQWDKGFLRSYGTRKWVPKESDSTFEDWDGPRPQPEEYMPEFAEGTATHFMMYEDTSEGTPISPAFATIEELARWLTDTNASAFGDQGASYEGWLETCKSGSAPSMVVCGDAMMSGVDAMVHLNNKKTEA